MYTCTISFAKVRKIKEWQLQQFCNLNLPSQASLWYRMRRAQSNYNH